MSQIHIANLNFTYDGSYDAIFHNVSLRLDTDWKLGLIGRNGRGKTTFLHLLEGRYAHGGTIRASVRFTYFPPAVEDTRRTAGEIANDVSPAHEAWQLSRELSLLAVDDEVLARPFATLSGGERVKLLLAALFLRDNNFLLIDEPTNHLDLEGRRVVGAYLNRKSGFILVSHDRAFLDGCIDHVLAIRKANIEIERGNFSSWQQNEQYRENFERAENRKLQGEIKRLEEAARRSSQWSDALEKTKIGTRIAGLRPDRGHIGRKAAKMMQSAKNTQRRRENAIDEKSALLKNIEMADELKLHPLKHHRATLAQLSEVALFYGEKHVCGGINLSIAQGERIALQGGNGAGKTSLLRLLNGETIAHTGKIALASGLVISYVAQDVSFLRGSLAEFIRRRGLDESLFKAILHKLAFEQVQFGKDLQDYSSGQKKKVLLAASLCERAHLYIWDEPLNFIDVLSRVQIETLLCAYAPTLLFVEHDQAFTNAVATRVVTLAGKPR